MEADISLMFCELYFSLKNKIIHITFTNNQGLNGYINGYYYEDLDEQNKIAIWHFIQAKEYLEQQTPQLNNRDSLLLPHKNIKEIEYLDNNSKIQAINFINK